MHRPNGFVRVWNALAKCFDELTIQLWHSIANGVGHVDGGCAFSNDGLQNFAQEIHVTSVAVFWTELDVCDQIASKPDGLFGLLENLIRRHAKFLLHVQFRGCNEGMNAAIVGTLQGFCCAGNITVVGARQ